MAGHSEKFKVVCTDSHLFPPRHELEILGKLNCEIVPAVCKSEDETIAACRDAHAVLNTAAKITRRVIAELKKAVVICRYGIGVDTVDIPAATEHGIVVANVPDFCFDEVADTAMSLILSVPRKVHLVNAAVHKGVWNKDAAKPVHKFRGATLGIFAFGNIGRNVAKRAIPFGFRILAHDAYLTPDQVRDYPVTLVDFDTLWGHRNDAAGLAAALAAADAWVPRLLEALGEGDILVFTADHGCDPTTPSTDHTREHVPLLMAGPGLARVNLGRRETFADLAATLAELLGLGPLGEGKSFADLVHLGPRS